VCVCVLFDTTTRNLVQNNSLEAYIRPLVKKFPVKKCEGSPSYSCAPPDTLEQVERGLTLASCFNIILSSTPRCFT
jgi:hypothetical protein